VTVEGEQSEVHDEYLEGKVKELEVEVEGKTQELESMYFQNIEQE